MEGALFGLAGVIVGAMLTWIGTAWSERSKRLHEGRILVRGEKLDAYGAFSAATKDYVAVLYRIAADRGIDSLPEKLAMDEAGPLLAAGFRARDQAFEKIRLIGSDDAIAGAREWVQLVYEMRIYLDSSNVDIATWSALVLQTNAARDRFHAGAREELAVV